MSHNRIKALLDSGKNSHINAKTSSSSFSLSNLVYLAPMFMLAYLSPLVGAREIKDGLDLSSQTWYRFNYSLADFAGLVFSMIDKCGFVYSTNLTNNTFEYAATPQCTQNGILGPSIEVGVEAGKNLTASLVECMNKVMLELCKDYYNHHTNPPSYHPPTNHNFEIFMIVAGAMVLIGSLTALCMLKICCDGSSHSDSYSRSRSYGSSDSGFFTGLALGSMLNSGGGSTYNSCPSTSTSSNVGVSWSFGKSPV